MYIDVWNEGLATIRKALTSSSDGAELVQPIVDKIIPMLADYQNPVRQNLPRKKGSGQNWIVNRRSVGTTPAQWLADTTEPDESTGSYDQFLFAYRTILTRGKITRKLQATGASYIDIMMEEIEGRMLEFKDYEDQAYMTGVSSAITPEGIQYLTTDNQMVACTTQQGGDDLNLALIDEAMDLNIGNPDMIITNRRTRREWNALLQAQQAFNDVTEVKGGFRLLTYNGVPIYTSTSMPSTILFNGTTESANTGGTSSSIFFVDTNHLWVGELTPIKLMPLAKASSQYDQFDIFCDEVLVLRNPLKISKLIGIWAGAD